MSGFDRQWELTGGEELTLIVLFHPSGELYAGPSFAASPQTGEGQQGRQGLDFIRT